MLFVLDRLLTCPTFEYQHVRLHPLLQLMLEFRHLRTALSKVLLLCVWIAGLSLDVAHQWGHMFHRCSHHHNLVQHRGDGESHVLWSGIHSNDQFEISGQCCALCDWTFSPQENPLDVASVVYPTTWHTIFRVGEEQSAKTVPFAGRFKSRRGPPCVI